MKPQYFFYKKKICFLCEPLVWRKRNCGWNILSKINFCLIEFWAGLTPQIPPFLVHSHLSFDSHLISQWLHRGGTWIWREAHPRCRILGRFPTQSSFRSPAPSSATLLVVAGDVSYQLDVRQKKFHLTGHWDISLGISSSSNERAEVSKSSLFKENWLADKDPPPPNPPTHPQPP